ncbi:MAG: ABC transporter permease [Acidobacteria bacterium]|nr:ABC transporter permease [Acidobacteriota bacterium]
MMQEHDSDKSNRFSRADEVSEQERPGQSGEPFLNDDGAPRGERGLFENRARVRLRFLTYRLRHPIETVLEYLATAIPSWLFARVARLTSAAWEGPRTAGVDVSVDIKTEASPVSSAGRPVVFFLTTEGRESDRRQNAQVVKELMASGWRVIRVVAVPSRAGRAKLRIDPASREETLRVPVGRGWRADADRLRRRELGIVARSIIALAYRENLGLGAVVCTSAFWLDVARVLRAIMKWPLVAVSHDDATVAGQQQDSLGRWSDLFVIVGSGAQGSAAVEHPSQAEDTSSGISQRSALSSLGEELGGLFPAVSIVLLNDDRDGRLRRQVHARTWYPNFEVLTLEDDGFPDDGPSSWLRRMDRARTAANGEMICFLKGPVIPGPGWLCSLVGRMAADSMTGVVTPASNAGIPGIRARGGYTNLAEFDRWAMKLARAQGKNAISVPFAPFTCVMIRQDLLEKLGGFDQTLDDDFLCGLDFARRVRRAGYDVQCVRAAYVHVPPGRPWPGGTGSITDLDHREEVRRRYREKWGRGRKGGEGERRPQMAAQPVYDSADHPPAMLAELQELIRYRDLVHLLTVSNIKTRYKRSVLGVGWTLLNPLLHMTVLTLAFSAVFKSSISDYPVYVLSGLIVWNFFSQVTTASMTAVISGGNLMRQIYIPPSVFCVATAAAGMVNLTLSLIPLVLIMVIMGHPFGFPIVFVPLAVLMLFLFSLGVALVLGTLAVFFTDLVEMYGVLLRAGYFLTAVMYPISVIPKRWRWIIEVNPVYSYIQCFRDPIYAGTFPSWHAIAIAAGSGILLLVVGWWVLARKAHEIVYRT